MEFIQYTFFEQWKKIKKYANSKGVEIIGDLPMYVARNSADVWANRHLFDLTEDGEPKNVAACRRIISASSARSGATRFITGQR